MNAVPLILSKLLATTAITDLVGQRINPGTAPQGGQLPDIVLSLIAGSTKHLMRGRTDHDEDRITIDVRALSYRGADAIGEAVVSAIGGMAEDVSGRHVQAFRVSDATDYDDTFKVYRRMIDFTVRHRPS